MENTILKYLSLKFLDFIKSYFMIIIMPNYFKEDLILYNDQTTEYKKILNQYLYLNTKLDTTSTNRHRFGFIYEENKELFFKLNLQTRLKYINSSKYIIILFLISLQYLIIQKTF